MNIFIYHHHSSFNMNSLNLCGIRRVLFSLLIAAFIFPAISCSQKDQISQWRGPQRDGIYPDKNLLKQWPSSGPDLLWVYEGLGEGHSSVSFSKDKIFVNGMPDSIGFLYALDFNGNLLWKKEYGKEWTQSFPGSRSTPTVVGELLYFMSGFGVVHCCRVNNGEEVWSLDIMETFNAKNIVWGMSESLLVKGDLLYCTPGGEENNLVALNRFTGETVWTSPGKREQAAYCSPILVEHNNTSLIVTKTVSSLIGVDAKTGEFYWDIPQIQSNSIHANSPVYYKGKIYSSSSNSPGDKDAGLIAVKLSTDGKSAELEWRNESFHNLMGGIIVHEDHIYASRYRRKVWCCLQAADGKVLYDYEGPDAGVIIWADGLFYGYTWDGEMILFDANPSALNEISKFSITHGTKQHYAHPVIHEGVLYVRHGDALMAYRIR